MRWRLVFLVASSLLCASCGPISKLPPLASEEVEAERRKQQVDHIRDYFAQRRRLNNVAFRIRTANHRDCKIRSAQIGLEAGTVPSLPRKFRSYSHEALSVSWDTGNRPVGGRDVPRSHWGHQTGRPPADIQQSSRARLGDGGVDQPFCT